MSIEAFKHHATQVARGTAPANTTPAPKPRYYQHGGHRSTEGGIAPTVMDRETGRIVAYATSLDVAALIVDALNRPAFPTDTEED